MELLLHIIDANPNDSRPVEIRQRLVLKMLLHRFVFRAAWVPTMRCPEPMAVRAERTREIEQDTN